MSIDRDLTRRSTNQSVTKGSSFLSLLHKIKLSWARLAYGVYISP